MVADREPDIAKLLLDPSAHFRSPREVVGNGDLSLEQKIEILRRWEYDEAESRVAEEEGMLGGNAELLGQIVRALDGLAGHLDTDQTPPTKQGGYPSPASDRQD